MLGSLASLGYGADEVIPVAFHVDYFNDPWKDPFSSPKHSQRQLAYNVAYNSPRKKDDIYFTPMLMVDGVTPMLGSDRPKAQAAIRKALTNRPEVGLGLEWVTRPSQESSPPVGAGSATQAQPATRRDLKVTVVSRSPRVVGKKLVLGVVTAEDNVTTKVPSGENAGKTLLEHFAARKFDHEFIELKAGSAAEQVFAIEVDPSWKPADLGVVVFVQDNATGRVYQAERVPWLNVKTGKR